MRSLQEIIVSNMKREIETTGTALNVNEQLLLLASTLGDNSNSIFTPGFLDSVLNNRNPNSPITVPSTPAASESLPSSSVSHDVITLPPIHTLNTTPAPTTNPKSTSPIFPTKKRKLDFYTIFSELKSGKRAEDIEFLDIEGQPPNTVFRFTETGISKYRDGLQKLCRENYKKLREYGVEPFDDNSQKQKVVYTRRLFQFVDTVYKRQKTVHNVEEAPAAVTMVTSITSSLLEAISTATKIHIIDGYCHDDDFWNILLPKIESGIKVKLLLVDPRSIAFMRRLENSQNFLMDVLSRIGNSVGKYKNFKLRLYQEDPSFSAIYIDGKLREMNNIPQVSENTSEIWKKLWERAIPWESADSLRKIITSVATQQPDTSVVVFRNRSMLGNNAMVTALEMSRKKVELYGISLADLFVTEFVTMMKFQLENNSTKFRILIKNPKSCSFESTPWSDIKHLSNSLKILSTLRETNKKLFDKKISIRLANRNNYFSYSRFDQQIFIVHHLGADYGGESSIVHQHWKTSEDKGQKMAGNAYAYQDFKKIFKTVWEESVVLSDEKSGISKSMTWGEALEAAQNVPTGQFLKCSPTDWQLLQEFVREKQSQLSPMFQQQFNVQ